MTAEKQENENSDGLNHLIDTIKHNYDSLCKDILDPILTRRKLEFDLFYNDDLRYRKMCIEIKEEEERQRQTEGTNGVSLLKPQNPWKQMDRIPIDTIQEREGLTILSHISRRQAVIGDALIYFPLIMSDKMPIKQGATTYEMTRNMMKSIVSSFETEIPINTDKSFNDMSEEEKRALSFNELRPSKLHFAKRGLKILKPFKQRFKKIPIDTDFMDAIKLKANEPIKAPSKQTIEPKKKARRTMNAEIAHREYALYYDDLIKHEKLNKREAKAKTADKFKISLKTLNRALKTHLNSLKKDK